jgi:hypothetical protein
VSLDFAIGKVYALVGRAQEALPALLRVTGTCSSLEDAMIVARARYYLGMAYEASSDKRAARGAYEKLVGMWPKGKKLVGMWPKGTRSQTVRLATLRLEVLSK